MGVTDSGFRLTREDLANAIERERKGYGRDYVDWLNEEWDRIAGDSRYKTQVLGRWEPYPPRDELIDRLNNRLKGKAPAPAINTRYWRGL